MFNKTSTLSILISSILFTACAGNNIKQQETFVETQTSSIKVEDTNKTSSTEVVLSDFPVEESSTESEVTTDTTSVANVGEELKTENSTQPIMKVLSFNFDKFEITEQNKALLKQHAEFLTENPSYVLAVNGHSDYRGPEIYNEKLSLRRANTVASLLISYGASESQLIINSFGSSKPVEDYDNWSQNRRVELEYSELYMVSK